jgi:membrane-associated protein
LVVSVLWIASLSLLGFFLGKEFENEIEKYLIYIVFGFILAATIPLLIAFLRRNINSINNDNNQSELNDREQ